MFWAHGNGSATATNAKAEVFVFFLFLFGTGELGADLLHGLVSFFFVVITFLIIYVVFDFVCFCS